MPATVAIVDYGSGNLRSCAKALERAARDLGTAQDILVTADADEVAAAERIVLPGVGAFADCMNGVASIPGMIAAMEESVFKRGIPFLGICVGMQLLAAVGREHGDHEGLGWIEGEVVRLTPAPPALSGGGSESALKIPHMGWNALTIRQAHPLLDGTPSGTEVYFLHSYVFRPAHDAHILATTDYGGDVVAMIARDNIAGVQFHPEKSQAAGLALLGRFLEWRP